LKQAKKLDRSNYDWIPPLTPRPQCSLQLYF